MVEKVEVRISVFAASRWRCGRVPTYMKIVQARSASSKPLPFAIMTSDDTHAATQQLLEKNKYYGLNKSQV